MRTEILCVTDESSSMQSLQANVISGFNEFLKSQRAVPGEARISHMKFATICTPLYEAAALGSVPDLTTDSYAPCGMTALNDAIGMTLERQGERIAKEQWADQVIVCIITDGGENSSRHYRHDQVKTMIEHAQAHGWVFIFLAANQDAFATGATLGIAPQYTANFAASAAGVTRAYGDISTYATTLRTTPVPTPTEPTL